MKGYFLSMNLQARLEGGRILSENIENFYSPTFYQGSIKYSDNHDIDQEIGYIDSNSRRRRNSALLFELLPIFSFNKNTYCHPFSDFRDHTTRPCLLHHSNIPIHQSKSHFESLAKEGAFLVDALFLVLSLLHETGLPNPLRNIL